MVAEKSSVVEVSIEQQDPDNHTHLAKVARLTRIRESTQHPHAWQAHAEHAITEGTGAVGTATVCLPLLGGLLLGKSSAGVGAHLWAHLHALTIDGRVDTEGGGRIQRVGGEGGRRIGLERLGNRCLRAIPIVGKYVTVRSVGAGISWCSEAIGGSRAVE